MKIINKTYTKTIDLETAKLLDANTAFIDIETTGFDRKHCHIYMIGLAKVIDGVKGNNNGNTCTIEVTLLFAENKDAELEILNEFLNYSKGITTFITFNGISFDFPFIRDRFAVYGISYNFNKYNQFDIYVKCKGLKNILKLSNLKQKTIEAFLGIDREDKFSGGELISQYQEYSMTGDEACYHNLITHNLEDVIGMADVLSILIYTHIYDYIDTSSLNNLQFDEKNLSITALMSLTYTLPNRFSLQSEYYYIIFEGNAIKIMLKPIKDELNYYLKDYKNYMYLTTEDIIIPKQLLNSSNKKQAIPATKDTCYIAKEGLFLPVYNNSMFEEEKLFKKEYKDKSEFTDISNSLEDKIYMTNYIMHIIKNILGNA